MHYEKRSKLKKRLPARIKNPLERPEEPNATWSLDFVSDAVECGRKFRVLNIIDDCDRLAIAQEVSMSMPAKRVIKILEKVIWLNGKPKNIRCDNGPEFIAADFQNWCRGNDINILFIQPGCPTQNSYIERFNGSFRDECLNTNWFLSLSDARDKIESFRRDYNSYRPHSSLQGMTPEEAEIEYVKNPEFSTFELSEKWE